MASSEKRCLYEVLGLSKDCSPDEIRSAYRRLALQRHPDKLIKSAGLAGAEATAQFQELVHAYEVLSDPRERAWYDSHRSQILFADHGAKSGGMPGTVPDLFAFYSNTVYSGYSDTGKGFYKIYADLFNSIYQNEVSFARKLGLKMDSVKEAPIMGNLESPYAQVTAFYNYWLGFSTVMDFCWVDQYDVMAGPNRKSRRVMEEENKKLRKKAKRDYNETVRGLAEFVKKRDKRVIDMMVKKNLEMQKKRADERERRKKMEKERLERAMKYEEPEWTKVQEEEEEAGFYEFEYEGDCDKKKNEEFYCIVCSKKFKSEKQWKNHEQSKKHKDKVVELRESLTDLEEELEEEEIDGFQGPCDNVGELHEKLKESLKIDNEEENGAEEVEEEVIGEESETGGNNFDVEEDLNGERGDEDDEMSILKTMALGHKNKKKNVSSKIRVENENDTASVGEFDNQKSTRRNRKGGKEKGKQYCGGAMADTANGVQAPLNECNGDDIVNSTSGTFDQSRKDEEDFLEYDKRKSTRKNRKGKKGREKKNFGEPIAKDINITKSADEDDTQDEYRHMEESHSEAFDRNESVDQMQEFNNKASDHLHDNSRKSKKSSKGKKIKGKEKNPSNMCDRCEEEFVSRNKLHKHLADTGHATLKSR